MILELIAAAAVGYEKPIDHAQAKCLATAIYFESRSEPVSGMAAVAMTVLNRVNSNRYPDTVCEVVYQPYQFSFTLEDPRKLSEAILNPNPIDAIALRTSIDVALSALAGDFEGLHVSKHYYNPDKASPKWAASFSNSFNIGAHRWVF